MIYLKKLIFAPFFLVSFVFLLLQFKPILTSTEFIFALSPETFYSLLTISALILLSSFLYVLFCTIADDWMLTLPVLLFACSSAFLFFGFNTTIAFFVLTFMSFLVVFLNLSMQLKNYVDFKPGSLFSSSVKYASTILIFALSVTYFLSITPIIQKQGFQIPDSLIDAAIKLTPMPSDSKNPKNTGGNSDSSINQLQIPQEQLDLLKKNPELLKQYNIDPKILDTVGVSDLTGNFVKQALKDQFDNMIKPYLSFIPIILSVTLFITFQSLVSLLGIVVPAFFWIIFFILEKIKFISFTEEMRPVKKMVV